MRWREDKDQGDRNGDEGIARRKEGQGGGQGGWRCKSSQVLGALTHSVGPLQRHAVPRPDLPSLPTSLLSPTTQ